MSNWRRSSSSRSAPSSGEVECSATPLGGGTLQRAIKSILEAGVEEEAKKDSSLLLPSEPLDWFLSSLWSAVPKTFAIGAAGSEVRGS